MIGFFTRLPAPNVEFTKERYEKAVKFMPLVGLLIGAIIVLIVFAANLLAVPVLIRGAVALAAYIFLTGGLHFDGLADTCDGVISGKTREQSLEIMKDSRLGVFGVLGIFIAGLFYFVLFTEIHITALIAFPVVGRACCLISASLAPYAREDGMGLTTAKAGGPASVASAVFFLFVASVLTIPLYILFTVSEAHTEALLPIVPLATMVPLIAIKPLICSIFAFVAAIIVTVFLTLTYRKRLGGVTGDTFGAVIEISSIVYLLVFTLFFT